MSEEKGILKNNKIENIIKYNEQLIEKLTSELQLHQDDGKVDDVTLLILEKQIGVIHYLKKLNVIYANIQKKIDKDAKAGKKTTLKKMKKVTLKEEKKKKKKKKSSSSSSSSDSDSDKKNKKTTQKKKSPTEKKA